MAKSTKIGTRRILVALDASPFGFEALEAATALAAELHAELQAMFVEDINLVRLAGLPFAREIAYSSAVKRQLDLPQMERTLRASADQIRRELATTCHQVRIEWSFNVTRGHVTRMPLEAATESDVLIIGREGSTLSRTVSPATRSQARPIVVVYDGSQSGQRALETARSLSRIGSHPIVVFLTAPSASRRDELRRLCGDWFKSHDITATYEQQAVSDASSLVRWARQYDARLLVINRESPFLDEPTIETLVNQLGCPVGLVR